MGKYAAGLAMLVLFVGWIADTIASASDGSN